jgi:hypothetical protein
VQDFEQGPTGFDEMDVIVIVGCVASVSAVVLVLWAIGATRKSVGYAHLDAPRRCARLGQWWQGLIAGGHPAHNALQVVSPRERAIASCRRDSGFGGPIGSRRSR